MMNKSTINSYLDLPSTAKNADNLIINTYDRKGPRNTFQKPEINLHRTHNNKKIKHSFSSNGYVFFH